jgi:hypothetical protein
VWAVVQPAVAVLSTQKNRSCIAIFQFRAAPVTWGAYQSPGPATGTYRQQLTFVFTRP